MEDPALRPEPSVEQKVDSLAEEVIALNRRHRATTYILVAAVIILLLSSAPSLMLYQLVAMHFRLEAFVNESIVALIFLVLPLSIGWAIRRYHGKH